MPFSYDINADDANRIRRRLQHAEKQGNERIEYKALGTNIGSLARGTAFFDPNAEDGDGDGLVQDNTPFERPAVLSNISSTLRSGLASASPTGVFTGGKSDLVGLTNREVAERVVPDNPADFIDRQTRYTLGGNDEQDKYIDERLFDPDAVEKLRELVENTLNSRPALRASWDRFGCPPIGVIKTDDTQLNGRYNQKSIYITQRHLNDDTKGKRILRAISGDNKVLRRAVKGVDKWLAMASPEDTVVHEWGHYLNLLTADHHPDQQIREVADLLYHDGWNLPNGVNDKKDNLGLREFWDYWQKIEQSEVYNNDPPSDDIPFVKTGYAITMPSEFIAEAIASYFSPDKKVRKLLNDAGSELVETMLGLQRNGLASTSGRTTSTGSSLRGKSATDIADIVVPKTLNEALALVGDHQALLALDDNKDADPTNLKLAFEGGIDALDFSPEAQEMLRGLVTDAIRNNPLFRDVVQRHGFPPVLMTKRGTNWGDEDDTFAISMIEGFPAIIINADIYNDKLARNKVSSIYPEVGALKNTERFLVSDRLDATLIHEWAHFINRSALANHPDPEVRALASFWWSESWDIDPKLKGLGKILSAMGVQAEDKFTQRVIGARKFAKKVEGRKQEKWTGYPHVLSQYGQMMPAEAFAEGTTAILVDDINLRDMVSPQLRDDIFDIIGKPRRYTRDIAEGVDERRAGLASASVTRNINGDRQILLPGDPGFDFTPIGGRDWLKDATNEEVADALTPRSHQDAVNLTIMNMGYGSGLGSLDAMEMLLIQGAIHNMLFGSSTKSDLTPVDFTPKGIDRTRAIIQKALELSPEFAYIVRTFGSPPIMSIDPDEIKRIRIREALTGKPELSDLFKSGNVMGWSTGMYGIVLNTASKYLMKDLPVGQRRRATSTFVDKNGVTREFLLNVDLSPSGTLFHEWFHGYYKRVLGWHSNFKSAMNTRSAPGQRQDRIDYMFPNDAFGGQRALTLKEYFDSKGFIPFSNQEPPYVGEMISASRNEIQKNGDDETDFITLMTDYINAPAWNPELAQDLADAIGQRYPYLTATLAPLMRNAYGTASRQEQFAEMGTLFVTPDKRQRAAYLTPEMESLMAFVLGLKDDPSVGDYNRPWTRRTPSSRIERAEKAKQTIGERVHTGSGIFVVEKPSSPTSDIISSENGIINASISGYEFSIVGDLPSQETAYTAWNEWDENWRMRYASSQIMGLGILPASESTRKWQSIANNHLANGTVVDASPEIKDDIQQSFMMAMSLMRAITDDNEVSYLPLFHSINNVQDGSPLMSGKIGDTISMPLTSFSPNRDKVTDFSLQDEQSNVQDALAPQNNRVLVQLRPGASVINSEFNSFERIPGQSNEYPIESITAGDFKIVSIGEENGVRVVEIKHERVVDPMLGSKDQTDGIDVDENEEKAGLASRADSSRTLIQEKLRSLEATTKFTDRTRAEDDVLDEKKRHETLTRALMSRGDALDRLDGPKTVGGLASSTPLTDRAKRHGVSLDAFDDEKFDEDDIEWSTNEWSLGKTNRVMAGDVVVVRTRNDGKKELLTIERKSGPFRGAVALPGGLQDEDEDLYDTAEREMLEEVNVSPKNAKGRRILGQVEARDWDPRFVEGGRIAGIRFDIDEEQSSVVKAGDDAGKFNWIDIEELSQGKYPIAFGHASWLAEAFADDPVLGPRFAVLAEASRVRNQRLIKKIDAKRKKAGVKEFGDMPDPSQPYQTTTEGIRTGLASVASSGRNINVPVSTKSQVSKILNNNIDYLNTNPVKDDHYGQEINGILATDIIEKMKQGKITHRDATALYLALKDIYNKDVATMKPSDELEMRMLMNSVRRLVSGNQDHKVVPFSRDGKQTFAVYRNGDYLGDYDTETDANDVVQMSMAERSMGLASASVPTSRSGSGFPEQARTKLKAKIDAKQQEIDALEDLNNRLRAAKQELEETGNWEGQKYNIRLSEDGGSPVTYTKQELSEDLEEGQTFEDLIKEMVGKIDRVGLDRKAKIDQAKEQKQLLQEKIDLIEAKEQNDNSFSIDELLADDELADELRRRNAEILAIPESERRARYRDDDGYTYVLHWGASNLIGGTLDPKRSRGTDTGSMAGGNTRAINVYTSKNFIDDTRRLRATQEEAKKFLEEISFGSDINVGPAGINSNWNTTARNLLLSYGFSGSSFTDDGQINWDRLIKLFDGDRDSAEEWYNGNIARIQAQVDRDEARISMRERLSAQLEADGFQYSSSYPASALVNNFGGYGGRYADEGAELGQAQTGDSAKRSSFTGIHVFRVKWGEDAWDFGAGDEVHLVGEHTPVASLIADNNPNRNNPALDTWAGWVDMVIEQDKESRRGGLASTGLTPEQSRVVGNVQNQVSDIVQRNGLASRTDRINPIGVDTESIVKQLELTPNEERIIASILPDLNDRESGGYDFDVMPALSGDRERLIDSIRVAVGEDGIPYIYAEPHPLLVKEGDSETDWSSVTRPTGDKLEQIREMYKKLTKKIQDTGLIKYWEDKTTEGNTTAKNNLISEEVLVDRNSFSKWSLDLLKSIAGNNQAGDYQDFGPMSGRDGTFGTFIGMWLNSLQDLNHPQISEFTNVDSFLHAHDVWGHIGTGRGFDRHGEWANMLFMFSLMDRWGQENDISKERLNKIKLYWYATVEEGRIKSEFIPSRDELMEQDPENWYILESIPGDIIYQDDDFIAELVSLIEKRNTSKPNSDVSYNDSTNAQREFIATNDIVRASTAGGLASSSSTTQKGKAEDFSEEDVKRLRARQSELEQMSDEELSEIFSDGEYTYVFHAGSEEIEGDVFDPNKSVGNEAFSQEGNTRKINRTMSDRYIQKYENDRSTARSLENIIDRLKKGQMIENPNSLRDPEDGEKGAIQGLSGVLFDIGTRGGPNLSVFSRSLRNNEPFPKQEDLDSLGMTREELIEYLENVGLPLVNEKIKSRQRVAEQLIEDDGQLISTYEISDVVQGVRLHGYGGRYGADYDPSTPKARGESFEIGNRYDRQGIHIARVRIGVDADRMSANPGAATARMGDKQDLEIHMVGQHEVVASLSTPTWIKFAGSQDEKWRVGEDFFMAWAEEAVNNDKERRRSGLASANDTLHPSASGPQKTLAHGSHSQTPPHLMQHPQGMSDNESYGNMSGSVIHTGTDNSISELGRVGREWLHLYEFDTEAMNQDIWGDDPDVNYSPKKEQLFRERTQNISLSDSESVPLKASQIIESGQAHAYRNRGEDAGNVSVAFPKSAIEKGTVRYVGTIKASDAGTERDPRSGLASSSSPAKSIQLQPTDSIEEAKATGRPLSILRPGTMPTITQSFYDEIMDSRAKKLKAAIAFRNENYDLLFDYDNLSKKSTKAKEEYLELIKNIEKDREGVYTQLKNALTLELRRAGFSSDEIDTVYRGLVDHLNQKRNYDYYKLVKPEEWSDEARLKQTKEALDKADIAIAFPSELLEKLIADGRFKSQFETNTSRGALHPQGRAEGDSAQFGYHPSVNPAMRPVFGYLTTGGTLDSIGISGVQQYGALQFILKRDIHSRSTYTTHDSLSTGLTPSPMGVPSADASAGDFGTGYTEAQIHGGIGLSDVDYAVVQVSDRRDWGKVSEDEFESISGMLGRVGIRVVPIRDGEMVDTWNGGNVVPEQKVKPFVQEEEQIS